MKKALPYIALFAALTGLQGCAPGRLPGKGITIEPSPCTVMPDSSNRVRLDLLLRIPDACFSRRNALFVTPELIEGDTLRRRYAPLVLYAPIYARKIRRLEVLEGYVDPYADEAVKIRSYGRVTEVPYSGILQLPEGGSAGRIAGIVSLEGCGGCPGRDTVEMASLSDPVTLLQDAREALRLVWAEPEFVVRPKVMQTKGLAHMQFPINRSTLDFSAGDNRAELERMLATLAPILDDTLATVNFITVTGMASADGPLPYNKALSKARAAAAAGWLTRQLRLSPAVRRLIEVDARPEGWGPVLAAMTADGNPDSVALKEVLERYPDENDDVQERYIRRLACWPEIRSRYLQQDRQVEYVYAYTVRSFTTDEELLEAYRTRPDAFNEEELLRVASLAQTDPQKKEVYTTLLAYFPKSQTAANNLAMLLLREDRPDEARAVLEAVGAYSPEMLNTLAASYVHSGDYGKAIGVLQQVDGPEARYNLGLLKARQRNLSEAYELLRPFGDVNSAVVALGLGRNAEAAAILSVLPDDSPRAEYARALAAARQHEDAAFYRHAANAAADEELKRRAASEADFVPYRSDERFRNLIK